MFTLQGHPLFGEVPGRVGVANFESVLLFTFQVRTCEFAHGRRIQLD